MRERERENRKITRGEREKGGHIARKVTRVTMESGSNTGKGKSISGGGNTVEVLDGSNIMELVGNKDVFTKFVNHKFHELDTDKDGKLSVKELQPAVADIGAALGLPAQGSAPDSDHIYSQVHSSSATFLQHSFQLLYFISQYSFSSFFSYFKFSCVL